MYTFYTNFSLLCVALREVYKSVVWYYYLSPPWLCCGLAMEVCEYCGRLISAGLLHSFGAVRHTGRLPISPSPFWDTGIWAVFRCALTPRPHCPAHDAGFAGVNVSALRFSIGVSYGEFWPHALGGLVRSGDGISRLIGCLRDIGGYPAPVHWVYILPSLRSDSCVDTMHHWV